jgi:hypothetical protein
MRRRVPAPAASLSLFFVGEARVVDLTAIDGASDYRGRAHRQQQRQNELSISASQLHYQHHRRNASVGGGRQYRCRSDHGE